METKTGHNMEPHPCASHTFIASSWSLTLPGVVCLTAGSLVRTSAVLLISGGRQLLCRTSHAVVR